MVLSITDFAIFTEPAPAEVIEDALVEILGEDAELRKFFHLITPVPDLFADPDRPLPKLLVTELQDARELEPSGEAELTLRFGLGIVYDESREERKAGERTIRACVHKIWQVLATNPLLEGTAAGLAAFGGSGALVHRFIGMQPFQWDQIALESDEEGTPGTTSFLQLAALYLQNVDAKTGNPTVE